MKKEINVQNFQRKTTDILTDTATSLLEGITGIGSSKREEFILSVGKIFQGLIKGKFLIILNDEWNHYKRKGKIKDDYQYSEQHHSCLQELLDFLDNDLPNEITFYFLKSIFLVAASEKLTDRESILPHQFIRICRRLSSGEIILLMETYRIAQRGSDNFNVLMGSPQYPMTQSWLQVMAKESHLKYPELVELHELELINKGLLTRRQHTTGGMVKIAPYFRLTQLGYDICSYIENYEEP
jgi:hypothetical protein